MEHCSPHHHHRPADGLFDLSKFPHCNGKRGREYLALVSNFVSKNKGKRIMLNYPVGATIIIGNLNSTIYSGRRDLLYGWGNYYLPNIVNMQVVGVVEGTSCPCDQLVLMTCEDRKLYAYDGEELHLVASSLDELQDKEIEYPACKSYYNGEAFKDMDAEDWAKVKKGKEGRRQDKQHQELMTAMKPGLLECLKITRQRADGHLYGL